MIWTAEQEALLKRLWAIEGLSASQIAQQIPVSRAAVTGKAHHMGLTIGIDRRTYTQQSNQSSPSLFAAPPEPDGALHLNLVDLEPLHCRFPLGEGPNFTFCGLPKANGAYCKFHAKICYNGG